ncbi:S-formylglutathione hydrolase [Testudinibacter aquarius]|uniref:S-formylglutathione hydrolase n=1 Tax=Testudinibacter aquarius TaxID=1524974 RepID=A0A4R3YA17_9PAST|nr:S-formylglutathione hydrolase [Testudinibacter aquarius]KAE9525878.1 S-formylglutathione hydrolase [Testudinibacter aquarius]TCV88750.1 S-formylglutathione hydrolase [Testudinibacter aquarius]TNG93494.1 S-formylglutathione hydrolase [Testudinibacter aquarius]
MTILTLISSNKMFGGQHQRYRHFSNRTECEMTFAIYLPPQAENGQKVPLLYWLSGLTCNDENFSTKAGAQRLAAQYGFALVMPDTSPRGEMVADADSYDLGQGAGFYLNAIQQPWATHYRMYDYIIDELPSLLAQHFPLNGQAAIFGHSMGGHGALMIGLKNSERFSSISAFAPIVNPSETPWGIKAFSAYLGDDRNNWAQYDSLALLAYAKRKLPILIDQGDADSFYPEQLQPQKFVQSAVKQGFSVEFNLRPGYDHSYYFIASFIEPHFAFHAKHFG